MGYVGELVAKWRALVGAVIGLASGMGLSQFVPSIMSPLFVKEFGWENAQFAAIGGLSILTVLLFPFIGRLTDVLGTKRTALIGVIFMPLSFLLLSRMQGSMTAYAVIFLLQASIGLTTTLTVYSRVIVKHLVQARGLALGIAASGPAIAGLLGTDLLNRFAVEHGWRTAYIALAVYSTIGGIIALLILPSDSEKGAGDVQPTGAKPEKRRAIQDYPLILRTPAFWILALAMLLVNCPQVLALQQMKFVLEDNGITPIQAGAILSALPLGMLLARCISGYLLDRISPRWVATIGLVLPSVGLVMMWSDYNSYYMLFTAVLLMGLSYGAEGDVVAFLIARNFGVNVYGSAYGLLSMVISASASIGTLTYSQMLATTGSYDAFLLGAAVFVFFGALSFLLLPTKPAEVHDLHGADMFRFLTKASTIGIISGVVLAIVAFLYRPAAFGRVVAQGGFALGEPLCIAAMCAAALLIFFSVLVLMRRRRFSGVAAA